MRSLLAVVLTVAGIGSAAPESIRVDSPLAGRYICSDAPFKREALDNPRGFEDRRTQLARVLRRQIERLRDDLRTPRSGWYLLARSGRRAVIGQGRPIAYEMRFERKAGKWMWVGAGGCDPRAYRNGITASEWRFDPDRPPGPDSTRVRALVSELACNSGEDARGRVQAPWVHYGAERVTVTYFIEPRDGFQTCPSNPDTPVALQLEEPLGNRELCDGGVLPARSAERENEFAKPPKCSAG